MLKDSKIKISINDVNEDFSKVTSIVDKIGEVTILKDNKPKYLLVDIDQNPQFEMTDNEKIEYLGKKILKKYHKAFEELAKR